jgi:purine nucleosidase
MKFSLGLICVLSFFVSASDTIAAEPARLIFDTDMGNDVDDALALGVIHSLQTRGECELLAVTVTKDNDLAAPFIDLVNTFYGRGDIPIGVVRNGVTPATGKFLPLAAKKDGDKFRYPHDLVSGKNAEPAVSLLRRIIAAQPDRSVSLVQVGFSTNFAELLKSVPDDHSKLTGKQLIAKKVKLLSVMAGAFKPLGGKPHLEYNVIKDIPSAKSLAVEWPTPIVYSGFEIGIAIPYPAISIERDYNYVKHHPLAEAYQLYNPPPHNRPTWDLTSVLYAVYPDRGYFKLSADGTVTVKDDGLTTFIAATGGRHRYLIADREHVIRVTEALVQLSSQPPR